MIYFAPDSFAGGGSGEPNQVPPPPHWLAEGLPGYASPSSYADYRAFAEEHERMIISQAVQQEPEFHMAEHEQTPAAPMVFPAASLPAQDEFQREPEFNNTQEEPEQESSTDGLFHQPVIQTDPAFVQPTIAGLKKRDVTGAPLDESDGAAPNDNIYATPPPVASYDTPSGFRPASYNEPESGIYTTPIPQQSPLYTGSLPGAAESRPAVVDGVPRYIPPDPSRMINNLDDSDFAKRAAAVACIICGIIFGLPLMLAPDEAFIGYSRTITCTVLMGPFFLLALFLFIGNLPSLVLGWLIAFGISALNCYIGLVLLGISILPESPIQFDTRLAVPFLVQGLIFPFALLIGTVGSPGRLRVFFGCALAVLAFAGSSIVASQSGSGTRLRVPDSGGTFAPATHGSSPEFIRFEKPAGFAQYSTWPVVQTFSPLASRLSTTPNYVFLDRPQNALVTIYVEQGVRRSAVETFGGPQSNLEVEVSRGFPRDTSLTERFSYDGADFERDRYSGITPNGVFIALTVDKARVDDRMYYLVVTTYSEGGLSTEERDNILNAFHETLEFKY